MTCVTTVNDADLQVARSWWANLCGQVPVDVRGLWFGLTDLVVAGEIQRTLYVAGCPTFDTDDKGGDWATEYNWWPQDCYVSLPGLAGLGDLDALQYAVAVVTRLRPQDDVGVTGVGVGFDDGDVVLTWPPPNAA